MATLKMLQVESKTHTQVKKQAHDLNMSIKGYIQMLIDSDTSSKIETYECKEFELKYSNERFDNKVKQPKNGKTFLITVRDK